MDKNWADMTWQERREERFRKWLDTTGINFVSPEAGKKYQARATRMIKAIKMEIPDRVPVHIPAGSIVAYNAGFTLHDMLYDHEKIKPAWIKFLRDYDIDSNDGPGFFSGKAYAMLDYRVNQWPGHGLRDDQTMHQFVEKEYMQPDEYDILIKEEFDFGLRYFLPRTWGAFEVFAGAPSFSSYAGLPQQLLMMCQDPAFRDFIKTLDEASREDAKWQKVNAECWQITQEEGFPPLMGGLTLAPFDTVADMLRGTRGSVMDMYRQPEKLLEALDVLAERGIKSSVEMADMARSPIIFIPMHKGDDSFMSVRQFEKFYWPTFRKLLMGIIDAGCVPMMVIDGSYNEARLEMLKDLPKTGAVWTMEKTDMFMAENILGGHTCIAGNVLGSQLRTQTPGVIKEYCRKLIEKCAPGGGYILSLGSSIDRCDPANLQAIIEAAKEYGVY